MTRGDWCRKLDRSSIEERGKPVLRRDKRMPRIVAGFKAATGATTITQVEEVENTKPRRYRAHCIRKGRAWEGDGYYEIELAEDREPALIPKQLEVLVILKEDGPLKDGSEHWRSTKVINELRKKLEGEKP